MFCTFSYDILSLRCVLYKLFSYGVREALEKENIPMAEADVTMIPQNYVELTSEDDIKKMNRILDMLDEDDDVQDVYHNWDE